MRDTIVGVMLSASAALVWVMALLAGRNPGELGPEIDSPFYDASVVVTEIE